MSIDYALAKELKEAGFPQTKVPNGRHAYTRDGVLVTAYPEHFNEKSELCIVPTLSELIEACGEPFLGLNKGYIDTENWKWVADTHTEACHCGKPECGGFNWKRGDGSTPEIAAARLWLALNKKTEPVS
jgi:hypothetical protein